MSEELMISGAEIEALARKLDGLDVIDDRERTILTGIFVLAGQAAADELVDVAGFMPTAVERATLNFANVSGLPGYLSTGPLGSSGLPGGFSWGMHGAGGGGGAGKIAG